MVFKRKCWAVKVEQSQGQPETIWDFSSTLRCLVNVPPRLLSLRFCKTPSELIWTPFINFEENEFFSELFNIFPFFVSTIQVQFQGKIASFCMHFSFLLYENLFLPLHNHYKAFFNFRALDYFDPPFIKFQIFSDPLVY